MQILFCTTYFKLIPIELSKSKATLKITNAIHLAFLNYKLTDKLQENILVVTK